MAGDPSADLHPPDSGGDERAHADRVPEKHGKLIMAGFWQLGIAPARNSYRVDDWILNPE